MDSIDFYLSGLSIFLSLFLLIVNIRALKKSRVRVFKFLTAVFALIFLDGLISVLVGFSILNIPLTLTDMFLFSNILILIIFYYGVVRSS
ncbi:MAG: hypothetical protein M1476_01555 [Candidatus Thermoplasmatota archaeon]|nr:hypothetical protein [Candidatus Thermoplasmatota archaeon]